MRGPHWPRLPQVCLAFFGHTRLESANGRLPPSGAAPCRMPIGMRWRGCSWLFCILLLRCILLSLVSAVLLSGAAIAITRCAFCPGIALELRPASVPDLFCECVDMPSCIAWVHACPQVASVSNTCFLWERGAAGVPCWKCKASIIPMCNWPNSSSGQQPSRGTANQMNSSLDRMPFPHPPRWACPLPWLSILSLVLLSRPSGLLQRGRRDHGVPAGRVGQPAPQACV